MKCIVKRIEETPTVEAEPIMETVPSVEVMGMPIHQEIPFPGYSYAPLSPNDRSALEREAYKAMIRQSQAVAETAEMQKRETIKADFKQRELQMKIAAQEYIEDFRELKNVRVFLILDKIKVAFHRDDGKLSIPKTVIEESFKRAVKYVTEDNKTSVMTLIFLKTGEPVSVTYSPDVIADSLTKFITTFGAQGIHLNISRRMKQDVLMELMFLFEELAEIVVLPTTVGYYLNESGIWYLAKPGDQIFQQLM